MLSLLSFCFAFLSEEGQLQSATTLTFMLPPDINDNLLNLYFGLFSSCLLVSVAPQRGLLLKSVWSAVKLDLEPK